MAFDLVSKVLTQYKADTSDHKAKIKELVGEEKKLAQERLKSVEQGNRGLESNIATLGKVGLALGAVTGAVLAGRAAFQSYSEDVRLRGAAAGVNIERLRSASMGLVAETKLLGLAAAANNATFKLSGEQMETVVKAALALRKQGKDLDEVFTGLQKAITEGSAEPLKQFGIVVEEVSGKSNKARQLMEILASVAGSAGKNYAMAGDDVARSGVTLEDSWMKLRVAAGSLVDTMAPLISSFAALASGLVSFPGKVQGALESLLGVGAGQDGSWLSRQRMADAAAATAASVARANNTARNSLLLSTGGRDYNVPAMTPQESARSAAMGRSGSRGRGGGGGGGYTFGGTVADEIRFSDPTISSVTGGIGSSGLGGLGGNPTFSGTGLNAGAYGAFNAARSESKLSDMFGPIEEFNAYADAFGILGQAVTGAFDAWITGSMSVGKAIKMAIAEGLRAEASKMLVMSLEHLAYAAGSVAFGNPAGAAAHLKSAGLFAAGAAAAGVAAKALGAGGSSGAGAGSSAQSGGAGGLVGGGSQGGGNNVTIVLGSEFDDSSPRRRQASIKRTVDRAIRDGVGNRAVSYG